jgi:hypothetical protein
MRERVAWKLNESLTDDDFKTPWLPRRKNDEADRLRAAIFEPPQGEPPSFLVESAPLMEHIRRLEALSTSPDAMAKLIHKRINELEWQRINYVGKSYHKAEPSPENLEAIRHVELINARLSELYRIKKRIDSLSRAPMTEAREPD